MQCAPFTPELGSTCAYDAVTTMAMNTTRDPEHDLILRELARDRNRLANERTMLAYMRTAIMLIATGGTLIKLFATTPTAVIGGWVVMIVGVAVASIGFWRFLQTRTKLT